MIDGKTALARARAAHARLDVLADLGTQRPALERQCREAAAGRDVLPVVRDGGRYLVLELIPKPRTTTENPHVQDRVH